MCCLRLILFVIVILSPVASARAQGTPNGPIEAPKKANARTVEPTTPAPEPYDGAPVEKMAGQCVTLDTELGAIEIAMMPEIAPGECQKLFELSRYGALDTTTFSRTVKDFVIQGWKSFDQ
jgi:hypothetical protein